MVYQTKGLSCSILRSNSWLPVASEKPTTGARVHLVFSSNRYTSIEAYSPWYCPELLALLSPFKVAWLRIHPQFNYALPITCFESPQKQLQWVTVESSIMRKKEPLPSICLLHTMHHLIFIMSETVSHTATFHHRRGAPIPWSLDCLFRHLSQQCNILFFA